MPPINKPKEKLNQMNREDLGVKGEYYDIPFRKIVRDKFELGTNNVEHRPLRYNHVKDLRVVYTGIDDAIIVAYSSEDKMYHIVDGQHRYERIVEQIEDYETMEEPETLFCQLIVWRDTEKRLDIAKSKNREIANKVSFGQNSGLERICGADIIYRVWALEQQYKSKERNEGKYAYIARHMRSRKEYSEGKLRTYSSIGNRLFDLLPKGELLLKAVRERWNIRKCESMIKDPEVTTMYEIKIKIYDKELAEKINANKTIKGDSSFWTDILNERLEKEEKLKNKLKDESKD